MLNFAAEPLDQPFVVLDPAQSQEQRVLAAKIAKQVPGIVRHRVADHCGKKDQVKAQNASPCHCSSGHGDRRAFDKDQHKKNHVAPHAEIRQRGRVECTPDLFDEFHSTACPLLTSLCQEAEFESIRMPVLPYFVSPLCPM